MKISILISCLVLLFAPAAFAVEFDLPSGAPVTIDRIADIINIAYKFFVWLASILMVVTIIYAGVKWAIAGNNPAKVSEAQEILKAGVIGAVIILGVGVILNTVGYFVETAGDPNAGIGGSRNGLPRGTPCQDDRQCASGACVRIDRNSALCQ